jgi:glycosyltransferase involved in cell wall biosynthesis
MKIAVIGSRGIPVTYSGIETHLEHICPRMVQKGHYVTVYCKRQLDHHHRFYKGVRLKKIPSLNTKHFETLTRAFISVFAEMVSDSDIVHFHAMGPSILAFLPRWLNKKTVVTVHGLDWQRQKWGKAATICLKASEWTSARFCQATICVSKTLKSYYDHKYQINSWYVPNGVEIPDVIAPQKIKAFGLKQNDYILFLSRLVPEKGVHYLIKAYQKLNTKKKLVIAGGAGHTKGYVKKIQNYASGNNNIIFTGFVSGTTLQELFSNAYLFVLPSEVEGLPIVLLEALSYGITPLVSDIPENKEVLNNCGFTFKNKNIESLADYLNYLVKHPGVVKATGKKGREQVERKYNWNKITDKTEQIYYHILNNG